MYKPSKIPNAFTLLETMIALFVLVVCLTWLGPIVTRVSSERSAVVENENALTLLNNELTQWAAGSPNLPAEVSQNQITYHLEWVPIDTKTIHLCIKWNNSVERELEVCGAAKH